MVIASALLRLMAASKFAAEMVTTSPVADER
jgi:hypothetical protein